MAKILEYMGPPKGKKGLRAWKRQQKAKYIAIQEAFSKEDKWKQYEKEDELGRKRILADILNL